MAYRETDLGLLIRLDPKKARAKLNEAYAKTAKQEGRADENAANYLGVGKSTVKRLVAKLDELGLPVKKPGDEKAAKKAG